MMQNKFAVLTENVLSTQGGLYGKREPRVVFFIGKGISGREAIWS